MPGCRQPCFVCASRLCVGGQLVLAVRSTALSRSLLLQDAAANAKLALVWRNNSAVHVKCCFPPPPLPRPRHAHVPPHRNPHQRVTVKRCLAEAEARVGINHFLVRYSRLLSRCLFVSFRSVGTIGRLFASGGSTCEWATWSSCRTTTCSPPTWCRALTA